MIKSNQMKHQIVSDFKRLSHYPKWNTLHSIRINSLLKLENIEWNSDARRKKVGNLIINIDINNDELADPRELR